MIRLAIIMLVVFTPVMAYAAASDSGADLASLVLNGFIAAMQVYLTSKLPAMDKRLVKVESDLKDFIEGVVR